MGKFYNAVQPIFKLKLAYTIDKINVICNFMI